MVKQYPDQVLDEFIYDAVHQALGAAVTSKAAIFLYDDEPIFSAPIDELVRTALQRRYTVTAVGAIDGGPPQPIHAVAWAIPRNRVLQVAALMRFLVSGDHRGQESADTQRRRLLG